MSRPYATIEDDFIAHGVVMIDVRYWDVPTEPAFSKFSFPLVRRVFPTLMANEIINVQPMTVPNGVFFSLGFGYRS